MHFSLYYFFAFLSFPLFAIIFYVDILRFLIFYCVPLKGPCHTLQTKTEILSVKLFSRLIFYPLARFHPKKANLKLGNWQLARELLARCGPRAVCCLLLHQDNILVLVFRKSNACCYMLLSHVFTAMSSLVHKPWLFPK